MRRFLIPVLVFIAVFAVSCSGKKKTQEENDYIEKVSKEIKAEEGGKVESSDGKTSVEIPAGALDGDMTITMTIYEAAAFPNDESGKIVSKVVDFEPSGTIFKKPVIITMAVEETFEKKILTAAVFKDTESRWSYNEHGVYAVLAGRDAGGDPIMLSAGGDPIMLNAGGDPIMMDAGGDPIMLAAGGDPIMLAAGGDPIMQNAAGDPIMNSAAGDPIMMTTGHFTAYTFIVLESEEESSDTEISDIDDTDTAGPDDDTDSDTTKPDDDTDTDTAEPEPEPVYSKVLCTNMAICTDGNKSQIYCPKEGEPFYGQDAQYAARKGCVPHHSYTEIPSDNEEVPFVKDNVTGLTWWFTGESGTFENMKNNCDVSYGGIDSWRLPTQKELLTLTDLGRIRGAMIDPVYFSIIYEDYEVNGQYTYTLSAGGNYIYIAALGMIVNKDIFGGEEPEGLLICVSGEEYGKVNAENYTTVTRNGENMISDSATNLFWEGYSMDVDSWQGALSYCANLQYAGYSDWRLPNRNELASLVDYSKAGTGAEVISSFPGMTPDMFWTSTPGNIGSNNWIIDMKSGVVSQMTTDEMEEEQTFLVRCVRSDLIEKPEIPNCDETGIAPCRDANGTIWSSVIYPEIFADFDQSGLYEEECGDYLPEEGECEEETIVEWSVLADMCRYLSENDSNKWRLPTIDEIRGIMTSEKLKKGGACGLTDECYEVSCVSGAAEEENCTTEGASQTALYDYGLIVSDVWQFGSGYIGLWGFNLNEGSLKYPAEVFRVSKLVQRCVLDESLNYEKTPYYDADRGLHWSDISPYYIEADDAYAYCSGLAAEDPDYDWTLPTVAALTTLLRECEDSSCAIDVTGKYSVLGDTACLWSSDFDLSIAVEMNFKEAYPENIYFDADDYKVFVKVRCVSSEQECGPADETPCTDSSSALMWSAMAPDQLDVDAAAAYCENLTEGGYHDWRLPDINELRTLIEECDETVSDGSCRISDPDYLSSDDWNEDNCKCEAGDSGYSKFGDAGEVILWSSSVRSDNSDFNWYVDFSFGAVDSSLNSGGLNVRCVR